MSAPVMVVRWAIMCHLRDGDGTWHVWMDRELFDTEDDARESARYQFSDFDREINDAFTSVVSITNVV